MTLTALWGEDMALHVYCFLVPTQKPRGAKVLVDFVLCAVFPATHWITARCPVPAPCCDAAPMSLPLGSRQGFIVLQLLQGVSDSFWLVVLGMCILNFQHNHIKI